MLESVRRLLLFLVASNFLAQTPPAPPAGDVTFENRVLFRVFGPLGGNTAEERAMVYSSRIEALSREAGDSLRDINVTESGGLAEVRAGSRVLFQLTEADAKAAGAGVSELARRDIETLREAFGRARESHGWHLIVRIVLLGLLYTALFLGAIGALRWAHRWVRVWANVLTRWGRKRSRVIAVLTDERLIDGIVVVESIGRWAVVLLLLNLYLNNLLRLFPGTEEVSKALWSYLITPLELAGAAALSYIPDLFFVVIASILTLYLVRISDFFFSKIEDGSLVFEGFYADWAGPTSRVVKMLLLAFGLVVIFPYLPGSKSPAFQGISIFVGVLISLGSGSTISNIVNGVILTYMRPFQLGEFIRVGETMGEVVEKSLLVVRLRTPKNEIVTIPNAGIMGGQIINYSAEAAAGRLVLYTTVTIGYDAPWQKVQELLCEAGRRTPNVLAEPAPFVLQTALNDFNVAYQVNVFTDKAQLMPQTYSRLHQNIQDTFNEGGVEILSPNYHALRDGNESTIPLSYRVGGVT